MTLSRRRLLQWSAVAAGAAALGTGTVAEAAEKDPDWTALRKRLHGALLLRNDAGYEEIRPPFNLLYDDRYPPAIARCVDADDIRKCVDFAGANHLRFAARSGGHSYVAYSTPGNGLVADLKLMNRVEVRRNGTAVVGPGARLIDVYHALAAEGRALPGGTCGSVGISGLALGGGIGVLMRKYGLTCDHLVGAKVVTPRDLRVRSVDPGSDLGWALTGGGGGNFGITAEFTFRTVPAPPRVTVFVVNFPEGSGADVYGAWQDWITAAPREFWSNISVLGGPNPAAGVPGCLLGGERRARELIADLERRAGVKGAVSGFQETDYPGAMDFWSGNLGRRRFMAASRVLTRKADPAKLSALVTGETKVALEVNPLDAAVSDVRPTDTAFAHRGVFGDVQVYLSAAPDVDRETAKREVNDVQTRLAEFATGGAYVNYLNDDQKDWATAYYGVNLPTLRAVAAKYDPSGVLAFEQGLSPCPG
ncbi:FAD-binding oxidoreductase [Amycolatopsis sp. VS8301801F10]|uniref:FAD-binding oxidoreductase n=1 Tax=Amycolatopsis sp. VS8301801F10 TaxID=2652442 RepID=UPI0038FC8261